ncbi:MAG: formylglycine-generating enzyme family protein [Spirochaetales bacterium]|nr:formylglycine-generating enzyme family protein [Spirochaetales bacterium]
MKDFFDALWGLVPITEWLLNTGMAKELAETWTTIIQAVLTMAALGVLGGFVRAVKELWKWVVNIRAARDLFPAFTYKEVKARQRYFIPTQFQNKSPERMEEPRYSHHNVSKNPLIRQMITINFNEKKVDNRFNLVLAGSGMGKTTFMVNLYIRYTSWPRRYKIRLYPFHDPAVLDKIKKIDGKEARKTILLLDAFDEDGQLLRPDKDDGLTMDQRFETRMQHILEQVRDFRAVIITCRTQYFPRRDDQEFEIEVRGDDRFYVLDKFYISPFTEKEIRRYLRKKYGVLRFWNWGRKSTACRIVDRSPHLMVRPMLLAYIDYLVQDRGQTFATTFAIYETLVKKWLEREADKRKHKAVDRESFIKDLHDFSRLVALEIFSGSGMGEGYSLSREKAREIRQRNELSLSEYEVTGQSLLTRDAHGNWKFAHKSIFEFYFALHILDNIDDVQFIWSTDFSTLDMTREFLISKMPGTLSGIPMPWDMVHIKGGTYLMGSPDDEPDRSKDELQHQVKVDEFFLARYPVTVAQFGIFIKETGYDKTDGKAWNNTEDHPAVNISWEDAMAYCGWLAGKTGQPFCLPTEAQWEYACRAGTVTAYNTGKTITPGQANFARKKGKTTPVGTYPANAWGLYDIHGNVWEWCSDWYGEDYYAECKKQGIANNPIGPPKGEVRVLRGGGWINNARFTRSACRSGSWPSNRSRVRGFRLARGQKRKE